MEIDGPHVLNNWNGLPTRKCFVSVMDDLRFRKRTFNSAEVEQHIAYRFQHKLQDAK